MTRCSRRVDASGPGSVLAVNPHLRTDRHPFEQTLYCLVRCNATGLGFEAEYHPVPQHIRGHGADVVGRNVITAIQPGPGTAALIEGDGAPRADSERQPAGEVV